MNTISQCSMCSEHAWKEQTSVCDCTVWCFNQGTCSLQALDFFFFFRKRSTGLGFRPTDSLHLPESCLAESSSLSVMKDKADWSKKKMVLLSPNSTFQRWLVQVGLITIQASSSHVPPKPGLYSHAATHWGISSEACRPSFMPHFDMALELMGAFSLRAFNFLSQSGERSSFSQRCSYTQRRLGDFLMCDIHCVYMCPCIYTCECMTQIAYTSCPS